VSTPGIWTSSPVDRPCPCRLAGRVDRCWDVVPACWREHSFIRSLIVLPQAAAALIAALAEPGRGWDAVVIGECERAFYGSQYALMAALFEHYGVQLWMPETGGRVDYASEHDEHAMTVLGLSSKREVTRTSIRVRTAMAVQVRE